MKTEKKIEARKLRSEQGMSVKSIARQIGVSQGTVSLWVRDIVLTPDQVEKLRSSWYDRLGRTFNRENCGVKARATGILRRKEYQNVGRKMARTMSGNKDFVMGCSLYWAEGGKDRCRASMATSDEAMVVRFWLFLEKYFDAKIEDVSVCCRYYTDLESGRNIERHWLDVLGLPETCLIKSTVNYYPKAAVMVKRRYHHGKLKYGTCRLGINSTEVVQKIFGAIQELAGIEVPQWLG